MGEADQDRPRRGRTWMIRLVSAAVLLGVGAGVGWAGSVLFAPNQQPLGTAPFTLVSAQVGRVSSSVSLNTVARWDLVPLGTNQAVGVVTGVAVAQGQEVGQGTVLYTVDLRPVIVAQGAVPTFRSITSGTSGEDVIQLQKMLTDLGFFHGTVDGRARWSTRSAVMAWQKSLGQPQTGTVDVGDVVFVPTLPTRVALNTDVLFRGAALVGGERVVQGLSAAPRFTVPVTAAQAAAMPAGTSVEVSSPGGDAWSATVARQDSDLQSGQVSLVLQGAGGQTVCRGDCGQLPVDVETRLLSRVVTVPATDGLVVPSAALATGADGQMYVIGQDGQRMPVTVAASAHGMSVVDGVAAGTKVRVPAATS